ncbi:MAG TPA: winged helix DNA-binding domain-containing protein [Thermoanaerobaculia bacterium]|nr:winged helix DNA-binding domain-containing protein [Thermoanaerobaculia bacterium]
MRDETAARRLHSQLLSDPLPTPHAVLTHFAALQAQDYLGALWAVGARTLSSTEADVERAIADKQIVRCWPMRGTLHFVAAEDVRWMLALCAPRALARHRTRLERDFALDLRALRRCRDVAEKALHGRALTRTEFYAALEAKRIDTKNGRGLQIVFALAHERVLCFGARRGKQPAFVLLDDWLPPAPELPRDEALSRLAQRYFRAHAPATAADLAWWSGLAMSDAKRAMEMIEMPSPPPSRKSSVHLLPPFDEYTVGYRDRAAVLDAEDAKRINAGGGIIHAIVVIDGRVAGRWSRTIRGNRVSIELQPFRAFTARETRALAAASRRYATFLGLPII